MSTGATAGAIIGGVIAGALIVAFVLAAWFRYSKRQCTGGQPARSENVVNVLPKEKDISPYGSPITPSSQFSSSKYDDAISEASTVRGRRADVEMGLRSPPSAFSKKSFIPFGRDSRPTSVANTTDSDGVSIWTSTTGELEHDRKVQNVKRAELREKRRDLALQSLREDDCTEY